MTDTNHRCEYVIQKGVNKYQRCIFNTLQNKKYCERHLKKELKDCPICLEKIQENKDNCCLECGHKFHLSCIFELYNQNQEFNNKCPMCRKEYAKQIERKEYSTTDILSLLNDIRSERQLDDIRSERQLDDIRGERQIDDINIQRRRRMGFLVPPSPLSLRRPPMLRRQIAIPDIDDFTDIEDNLSSVD
jgi:hypothetical protein